MSNLIKVDGRVYMDLDVLLDTLLLATEKSMRIAEITKDDELASQTLGIVLVCQKLEETLTNFREKNV